MEMMGDMYIFIGTLLLLFVDALWGFCLGFFVANPYQFMTGFPHTSRYCQIKLPIISYTRVQSLWTKANALPLFASRIVFSYLERTPM